MKRMLHALLSLLLAGSLVTANAQNTYFTEYFDDQAAGQITGKSSEAPTSPVSYTISSGLWTFYFAYRAGSGCTPNGDNVVSQKAIRLAKNNTTTPAGLTPPAYMISPLLNYGVTTVSWKNAKSSTSGTTGITISKSTNGGDTWTPVSPNPIPTTDVACDSYIIVIADPFANRIRIENNSNVDQDIDNVTITSVVPILPVRYTSFNCMEASGKVKLSWNIATELNVTKYVVERSANGREFNDAGAVAATQSASYTWLDQSPISGTNYYRVKSVDRDGAVQYTGVVKVTLGKTVRDFVVSPNPVRGRTLNLQFNGFEKGRYSVVLFNSVGQRVFSNTFDLSAGSSNKSLQLPTTTQKGIYSLQLVSDGKVTTKSIVVE